LFAAGTAAGAVAVGEERALVVVTDDCSAGFGASDFWQPIMLSETITRTAISARIFFTKVTSLLSGIFVGTLGPAWINWMNYGILSRMLFA